MTKLNIALLASSILVISGCGHDHDSDSGEPPVKSIDSELVAGESLPTSVYYTVSRDMRRCMSPMCGGYFMHAVNTRKTTCADGHKVDSETGCYVWDIETGGVDLQDGDLVTGEFNKPEPDVVSVSGFYGFELSLAFRPLFDVERQSYFRYNLVRDNGLRCFTTPCPSTDILKLNTRHGWNDGFSFDEVDSYGGNQAQARAAFDAAYASSGALTDGHWHSPRMTGHGWELMITNLFVPLEMAAPACVTVKWLGTTDVTAWNFASEQEANSFLGGLVDVDTSAVTRGGCAATAATTLCTEEYAPICATIDADQTTETYSNECHLTQRVRAAAGDDSKATGKASKGECSSDSCNLDDPKYDYVGNSTEECSWIRFSCDPGWNYFKDNCGCGCFDLASGPGELCGGFANAQCVQGLTCEGLGDNGSSAGICTCPAFLNCMPGPGVTPCDQGLLDICPDTQIAW